MRGQPGHNTRPYARLLSLSFLGMGAWLASPMNVALISKLRESLIFLAYFLTCYPFMFVQPGTGRRPDDWCRNYMHVL